jgi:hypothetical protein
VGKNNLKNRAFRIIEWHMGGKPFKESLFKYFKTTEKIRARLTTGFEEVGQKG